MFSSFSLAHGYRIPTELIEFFGFATAVTATAFLSLNLNLEFPAFLLYGASNIAWIIFALRKGSRWLFWQNVIFSITSVIGLINFWP